jgi:hypothetical protein
MNFSNDEKLRPKVNLTFWNIKGGVIPSNTLSSAHSLDLRLAANTRIVSTLEEGIALTPALPPR